MKKILIVDDENKIRELIRLNLELAGYNCIEASDGNEAITKIAENPDLVLLDIMLPGKDGYEISQKFIEKNIPIIFLTAKDSTLDKVSGLKLGAEDYITKPFEAIELLARIEVVLRRYNKNEDIFKHNDVEINFKERTVTKNNEIIEVTMQEFELLDALVKNKNLALSREKLLEIAWGYEYMGDTRTIDIHIQRLRKKLNWENVIQTVYKYGYRLEIR